MTALARLATGLALAAVLLLGCVPTSEHPILSKTGAKDPALLGTWRGKMEDGAPVYMHVMTTKEGEIRLLLVTPGGAGAEADSGWGAFRVVTAEVKGTRYLSALWDINDGKPVEGRDKGYHLLRYAIAGGGLQLYGVNEDKLREAVKAGKVAGTLDGEGASAEVRLTAPSDKLVKFLGRSDPAALFDKPFAALTKVAD